MSKLAQVVEVDEAAKLRPQSVCRLGLSLRRTLLTVVDKIDKQGRKKLLRFKFTGLFTDEPIPRGGFIAFYQGVVHTKKPAAWNRYVYDTTDLEGNDVWVVPRMEADGTVDPRRYPAAMVNEPLRDEDGEGGEANAMFFEWESGAHVERNMAHSTDEAGRRVPRYVKVMAIHATRDISPGEEIYVHYGRAYARPRTGPNRYHRWALENMGVGTSVSQKTIVAARETPADYLERTSMLVPADAVIDS